MTHHQFCLCTILLILLSGSNYKPVLNIWFLFGSLLAISPRVYIGLNISKEKDTNFAQFFIGSIQNIQIDCFIEAMTRGYVLKIYINQTRD